MAIDPGTRNMLITVGILLVLWLIQKRRRKRPETLEPEEAVARIQEKRETIKYGSKHEKVLRKKLITAYIIVSAIWIPFYGAIFRRALASEGHHTWLGDLVALIVASILSYMIIHGAILQMGTQAIRGKEFSLEGEPTKIFNVFVKNRIKLEPAFIRQSLQVWDETRKVLSEEALNAKYVSASEAAREDPTEEFYDFTFEDESGLRRRLIHKNRVQFMEKLSVIDFQKVQDLVNTVLERRMGQDASIARLVSEALRVRMETLFFKEQDTEMFKLLIEGTDHIVDKDAKKQETNRTQAIMTLWQWILKDRFQLENKDLEALLKNKLPAEISSLNRTVEDGIYFGGFHAEFCELSQYDTKYAIFAMPYTWNTALLFNHRDWIESSNIPFKMFYTDMAWQKLETLIIQIAPKEYEYCNVLVPLYTEYDVDCTKGVIAPHPIDDITGHEFQYMFQEKAAEPLLFQLIEAESKIQQKDQFEGPERKLLARKLLLLWHSLQSLPQMLRAMWPYIALTAIICLLVGYYTGQANVSVG